MPEQRVLALKEIQGNVIPGFNKDYVRLLFVKIDEPATAKRWIKRISTSVATAQEVSDFNQLFKQTVKRRGFEGTVKSTWINIAFSFAGLRKLVPADAEKFTDVAFRHGAERAGPDWVADAERMEPDIVVIIAADDARDLDEAVERVKHGIDASGPCARGVRVIFEQPGETRADMRGYEHFGWRDGISQPGLRGFTAPSDPEKRPEQGLPGQDLLWPGEFIFGYETQERNDATAPGPNSLMRDGEPVVPHWAKNGSYLVYRRLRQDVGAFHRFLHDQGANLGVGPEALGARLVGRWASGAPLVRTPTKDKPRLGGNPKKNNDFEYGPEDEAEPGPKVPRDPNGVRCPFSAHIRKAYPRDETADHPNPYAKLGRTLNESDTQTHRLLRRGIPYGRPSASTPLAPVEDAIDRGLLFMAYMTSITDQFEFVTCNMVDNPHFVKPHTGVDPIIGDTPGSARDIRTVLPRAKTPQELELGRWVTSTGGGYFFAPSIDGLQRLAT